MKNTRREFLTGLTKVAGGAVLGYVSLPVLAGCLPTSLPLEPEQTTAPIGPDGRVAVDISLLTQANPSIVAPNVLGQDSFGVIVTLTPDGLVHAFSMRCTHQYCSVDSRLTSEEIHCSCHGSTYHLDGTVDHAVISGQAPLTSYAITPNPPIGNVAHVQIIPK